MSIYFPCSLFPNFGICLINNVNLFCSNLLKNVMTQATTINVTPLDIINARLSGYVDLQKISVDSQGKIAGIYPMASVLSPDNLPNIQVLDVEGDWISLTGVDLQINGGLGLAFNDVNIHHRAFVQKICELLGKEGIDGFLPTLVTTSIENIQRSLRLFADFAVLENDLQPVAHIWGVHLEGPFLNPHKRGAHPSEHLIPLTIDNVKRVLGDYASIVKIITLAPELDSTGEVIPYLRSLGITVSLGHSLATATQAQQAFAEGATMVTHSFNAMPELHHREPGLLGEAIAHPKVMCGLIADGQHVCPTMIQLLLRASCYEKGIFLVSDALAPLGLPDGIYPWDTRQIEVEKGTAWIRLDYHTSLQNGILAGTTLPLLKGVENLVKWGICEVDKAISLATEAPRKAIGLPGFEIGQNARFLRWHFDESTKKLSWQRLLPCLLP